MGSLKLGDFRVFEGMGEEGGVGCSSLVLDGERGELVRAPVRIGRKGGGEGGGEGCGAGLEDIRALMALKNHSEAERRRRERINSHLAKLRSLIPTNSKLDKASLLAEVINHVKELRSQVTEVSLRHTIPSDTNDVHVEAVDEETSEGGIFIKASLCCEDHPELIAELRQMLQPLQLKTVSAEISTFGGRVRHVFALISEGNATNMEKNLLASSLQQSLKSILDRVSLQPEISPKGMSSGKRRRISHLDSSSSSS